METRPAILTAPEDLRASRGRRRALIESAVAYLLILAVIWTPRPAQRWLWWLAAASVAAFTWVSFDGWRAMGFRPANIFRSAWVVLAAVSIAGIAIAIAAALHTLRLPPGVLPFIANYAAYAIWAFVQQFLLQSFFLHRFTRLFSSGTHAAIAAAGVFALAHLPNPVLAPITFVWGVAACLIFLRSRNLYPLALAHAIFGIAIAVAVPGPVDHNMRVGWSYIAYARHPHKTQHSTFPMRSE